MEYPKVILSSGKDQSLKRRHPWVFSGAIKKIQGDVNEGDVVEVYSTHDEYLGTGHYQDGSIAVRVFSFQKIAPGAAYWKRKIEKAYNYRKELGLIPHPETNVYRLVYAEGDELPGLIIDYYNGTAVLQAHSIGMHLARNMFVNALKEIYGSELKAVYDKSQETLPKKSGIKASNGYLSGNAVPIIAGMTEVMENNHRFYIDWESGQKTGFFIDQRENRALLAKYCKDKKVLNTFCYTGGFSVYAGKAGASLVHSVDSSQKAITLTNKNTGLNNIQNHESFAMDTFDFLKGKENVYDVIVLDPPAFAKHQHVKHNAVMGYKRLNAEAMKAIKPGGIIFTFSCSQVVDKSLFRHTIMAAAIDAKRNVNVLHYMTQPVDHPINIFHPEGEYLKGLVLYVE